MRRWQSYLVYECLRLLDYLFPGWQSPREEPADYLSEDSRQFWLSRVYKGIER